MPEMNGVDATKLIKERWPEIKVIILTTFQEVHYVVDALSAGAEGYLLKAINPADLAAGIKWVSQGGTLIPQDIAKLLISGLNAQQPAVNAGGAKTAGHFGLSERELQVLSCISDGLHNKDIASRLFLSEGTVKNYISSIYSKLDVRDRVNAAKKAKENGLLS
jgi:DNA-binding NarL/FixJ family response regulator